MKQTVTEVEVNGVKYVQVATPGRTKKLATTDDEGRIYCIVRCDRSGVFAGYVHPDEMKSETTVYHSRWIWYWDGGASLFQLSQEGVKVPENCQFPCVVEWVKFTDAIQFNPCTQAAIDSIAAVPVWERDKCLWLRPWLWRWLWLWLWLWPGLWLRRRRRGRNGRGT